MTENTDENLALLVQNGSTEAFGTLIQRYEAKISRYARRFLFDHEDTKDLVQEVFLKAYINIKSFDTKRSFSSWVYRIAHNEFINAIKKKGREPLPFFDPDTLFPHPLSKETPDQEFKDVELKQALTECLKELVPKYREVLVLYFFEELDYQKISEILHIPTSTVGVRLKRAKQALGTIYKKLHPTI
jgi:RNA polymerase sigma-70 factor, ECF subfamily